MPPCITSGIVEPVCNESLFQESSRAFKREDEQTQNVINRKTLEFFKRKSRFLTFSCYARFIAQFVFLVSLLAVVYKKEEK